MAMPPGVIFGRAIHVGWVADSLNHRGSYPRVLVLVKFLVLRLLGFVSFGPRHVNKSSAMYSTQ